MSATALTNISLMIVCGSALLSLIGIIEQSTPILLIALGLGIIGAVLKLKTQDRYRDEIRS
jgi:hypothetical protein